MVLVLKALLVGLTFGAAVRAFGLPIPAPPTAAGVLGVAGVTLGFVLASWISRST